MLQPFESDFTKLYGPDPPVYRIKVLDRHVVSAIKRMKLTPITQMTYGTEHAPHTIIVTTLTDPQLFELSQQ